MSEVARAPDRESPRLRMGLSLKLALSFIGLVSLVLLINGAVNMWLSYGEAKRAAVLVQQEKAQAAAERIQQFVGEIEQQIGWTTHAQWSAGTIDQRRYDFVRLLRQVPAITELVQIDGSGKEQLKVSRLAMDVVGAGTDLAADPRFAKAVADKIWYSPVYFRKESEPYMTISIAHVGRNAGVTVAEVNLKFIWDVVTSIKVGEAGYAYVVNGEGRLIAHPDISLVLRDTDLSRLPQVADGLAALKLHATQSSLVTTATGPTGTSVLTAFAAIPHLDWLVFVELPSREALAPVYASLTQTGALLGVGLLLAAIAGAMLARRMTVPIHRLQSGAERLGAGELDHRIDIRTGDEIEVLAGRFNRMAGQLQDSYATLESKVETRTRDLTEALDRQTATSEVLRAISRSPGDLQSIFATMLENATRICQAEFGRLALYDGESFINAAVRGATPQYTKFLEEYPNLRGSGSALDRMASELKTVHLLDIAAGPGYQSRNSFSVASVELGGARSMIAVPLLKEHTLIGGLVLFRKRVEAFTEKQIELVTTFADQAVIAIENSRLLGELRTRNADLAESLDRQTATSEVLRAISRSPTDTQPVFDAIAASAQRLCEGDFGVVIRFDGELAHMMALHGGAADEFAPLLAAFPSKPVGLLAEALEQRTVVHAPDITTDPRSRLRQTVVSAGGRAFVFVPMLREGAAIGAILVMRRQPRAFTDTQIELLKTFADQAVIAIENARLLGELRDRSADLARSVDELTTLREVGQAVSSTLDLGTVLETIVARAVGLAGADAGAIYRYRKGDRQFRLGTSIGLDEAIVQRIRGLPIREAETMALARSIQERAPAQIPDLEAAPHLPLRDLMAAGGFRAVLMVPLIGADRVFGVLSIQKKTVGEFPESTVRLMQTFATQSVLAIQNARLFREVEEQGRALALASQHKSQFLANMSHELRTPLNAILGYAELLVDGIYGELSEKARGVLERVQTNGRHLLGLINDVLDLSKIEAGQLTLAVEDYAMPAVVHSVVSATESLAKAKGLALATDVPKDLPLGSGDERRLTQVILNLVGNAIKFTDKGSVVIAVTCANGRFDLAVTDTGPGIAEADRARIFEEFQQVDNSNTRRKGGTGLGLSISKKIVELHGGAISVESELGKGSTFHVIIPVKVAQEREVA